MRRSKMTKLTPPLSMESCIRTVAKPNSRFRLLVTVQSSYAGKHSASGGVPAASGEATRNLERTRPAAHCPRDSQRSRNDLNAWAGRKGVRRPACRDDHRPRRTRHRRSRTLRHQRLGAGAGRGSRCPVGIRCGVRGQCRRALSYLQRSCDPDHGIDARKGRGSGGSGCHGHQFGRNSLDAGGLTSFVVHEK
jgi:hypothetical protein